MIDKIATGELSDIVQTLCNSDILLVQAGTKGSVSRARASAASGLTKTFKVSFKCELEEI